jgi:hypothetical protein
MLDPETKTIDPVTDPKAEKALAVLTDEAKKETDKVDALKTEGKIDETEANKQKESIVKKLQKNLQKKVAKYLGKLKAGPVFYKGQEISVENMTCVVVGLGRYEITVSPKAPGSQAIAKDQKIEVLGFPFFVRGVSEDCKQITLRVEDKNTNINIDFVKTQKPNLN